MRRLSPVLLFTAVAICLGALSEMRFAREKLPGLPVQVEGFFAERGRVPSGLRGPGGIRWWNSWDGDDKRRGTISFGPFAAPAEFVLEGIGYPRIGGNRVYVENQATGEIHDPEWPNLGEAWRRQKVRVPEAWRGAPITVRVVDDSEGWGAWLAVSEPFVRPWWAAWWTGAAPMICGIVFGGIVIMVPVTAVALGLARWPLFQGPGRLMAAGAAIALTGYALLGITFAHAPTGAVAGWVVLVGAAVVCLWPRWRRRIDASWHDRDWSVPVLLMVAVAVLGVALLTLFTDDAALTKLAANRFREALPTDNDIPRYFAERLRGGHSLVPFLGDWLSSDRPPLQAGWILLFAPVLETWGLDFMDAATLVAVWMHLLWIPAVWWWLRASGATTRVAALVIVAVAPCGFFIINSVYVWPKLSAGAFMVAAFTCWITAAKADDHRVSVPRGLVGGAFAALATLTHGGSAFALLGLAPLALWRFRRANLRGWIAAATIFLVLGLPWTAYKKFHDPPGNRLPKWHLAGVIAPDSRGTLETLVDSYGAKSVAELARDRWTNVRVLFAGPWRQLATFDVSRPYDRVNAEFFYPFFALGWWNLGFAAPAIWSLKRWRDRHPSDERRALIDTGAWVLGTFVVWVALLFLPGTISIIVGSYAPIVVLFPALAFLLWRAHPAVFGAVAAAQLAIVPFVWMAALPAMAGQPWRGDALAGIVVAIAAMWVIAVWPERTEAAPARA